MEELRDIINNEIEKGTELTSLLEISRDLDKEINKYFVKKQVKHLYCSLEE